MGNNKIKGMSPEGYILAEAELVHQDGKWMIILSELPGWVTEGLPKNLIRNGGGCHCDPPSAHSITFGEA